MFVFTHYYTKANIDVTLAREGVGVAEPKVILGYCSLQYNSFLFAVLPKIFPIILKKRRNMSGICLETERGDNLSVDC